jgi:hypothetical protein
MILSRVWPFVGNSDTDRSGSKQGLPIAAKCENVGYATNKKWRSAPSSRQATSDYSSPFVSSWQRQFSRNLPVLTTQLVVPGSAVTSIEPAQNSQKPVVVENSALWPSACHTR